MTGVSRALKKAHNPKCIVVGIDPVSDYTCERTTCFHTRLSMQKGSVLAFPDSLNNPDDGAAYIVEGIGYDFIPDVLSRDPVDVNIWVKTEDEEAWVAVRSLMRTEGLLVGGSSGSALCGALRWLKSKEGRVVAESEGMNVVVLLPDG